MNRNRTWRRLIALVIVVSPAQFLPVATADEIENAQRMCGAIDAMGADVECAINVTDRAVEVTADTTQVDAMQLCTSFSGMLTPLASMLADKWTMRVFATGTKDEPEVSCDIG